MESKSADGGSSGCKPRRIQLKRVAGNKLPPNTVKVDRSGIFGNPFSVEQYGREGAVSMHRAWLLGEMTEERIRARWPPVIASHLLHRRAAVLNALMTLRGKNLGCWCPEDGGACHGDLLLVLANRPDVARQ
jgi:hypothetical protein